MPSQYWGTSARVHPCPETSLSCRKPALLDGGPRPGRHSPGCCEFSWTGQTANEKGGGRKKWVYARLLAGTQAQTRVTGQLRGVSLKLRHMNSVQPRTQEAALRGERTSALRFGLLQTSAALTLRSCISDVTLLQAKQSRTVSDFTSRYAAVTGTSQICFACIIPKAATGGLSVQTTPVRSCALHVPK